jgi:hypothetical protein
MANDNLFKQFLSLAQQQHQALLKIHGATEAEKIKVAEPLISNINYLIKDLNSEHRAAGRLRKKEWREVIELLVKLRADAKRMMSNDQIFQFGKEIEANYKIIREKTGRLMHS